MRCHPLDMTATVANASLAVIDNFHKYTGFELFALQHNQGLISIANRTVILFEHTIGQGAHKKYHLDDFSALAVRISKEYFELSLVCKTCPSVNILIAEFLSPQDDIYQCYTASRLLKLPIKVIEASGKCHYFGHRLGSLHVYNTIERSRPHALTARRPRFLRQRKKSNYPLNPKLTAQGKL